MKKTILTLGILTTLTSLSFGQIDTNEFYDILPGDGNGIRFWGGSPFGITLKFIWALI